LYGMNALQASNQDFTFTYTGIPGSGVHLVSVNGLAESPPDTFWEMLGELKDQQPPEINKTKRQNHIQLFYYVLTGIHL
ncbi:hypothetical protein T06_6955, partial [Trichinella sp. T6]